MSKGVSGHIEPVMMELTAAGLHGIFTRFPNPLRREVTPFFANGQHSRSKKEVQRVLHLFSMFAVTRTVGSM